jgi:hypothetical protein
VFKIVQEICKVSALVYLLYMIAASRTFEKETQDRLAEVGLICLHFAGQEGWQIRLCMPY